MRIRDTKTFIEKAREVHGAKYDYSKAEYIDKATKVCIICPEHGEFWQTAHQHVNRKCECRKCADKKRAVPKITTEEWIDRARDVHGNKYDYSKAEYVNQNEKLCIICPEHGEFWQTPTAHTFLKEGCPKCSGKYVMTNEEWIEKARGIHGNKYDYSKTVFTRARDKVCIICPEHGEFWQVAYSHLEGYGCKKCAISQLADKRRKSKEKFIEDARKIHGDKYDYSKVEYKNAYTKVCIICPEHGEFWQSPTGHIANRHSCPECKLKSKMELFLKELFEKNNIKYIREKKFDWLKHEDNLKIDFFLPDYNLVIECQGIQHFMPINFFGGDAYYGAQLKRDKLKYEKCVENGLKVQYVLLKKSKRFIKNDPRYKDVLYFEDLLKDNSFERIRQALNIAN